MVSSGKTRRRRPGAPLAALIILMFAATVPVTAADTNAVLAEQVLPQQDTLQADTTAVANAEEEGPEAPDVPRVVIVLDKGGEIVMELMPEEAPLAVERFTLLVNDGFYNGLKFHRVESWLIQTGKKETEVLSTLDSLLFKGVLYMERKIELAWLKNARNPSTSFHRIVSCKYDGSSCFISQVSECKSTDGAMDQKSKFR